MLRYERKYLVPNGIIDVLRQRLQGFVVPDKYTNITENGLRQYTVRSIYFDNQRLDCYSEKQDGLINRRKFRIRGYNDFNPENSVVMEIKRKIESRVKKHRSFVVFKNVEEVLSTGQVEKYVVANNGSPARIEDAMRFLYHIHKYRLLPTCLIAYEREAWFGKFDKDVRITFDKNVRSRNYPNLENLYSNDDLTLLFKDHFVLEIKYCSDKMPVWARTLVQEFKLRNDAISKYTIGYDVACRYKFA